MLCFREAPLTSLTNLRAALHHPGFGNIQEHKQNRYKQNTGLSVSLKDLCLVALMHSSHFRHKAALQEPQPVPAAGSWRGAWSIPNVLVSGCRAGHRLPWLAGEWDKHSHVQPSTVTTLRAATYFGHFTSRQLREVKWKLPPALQTNAII